MHSQAWACAVGISNNWWVTPVSFTLQGYHWWRIAKVNNLNAVIEAVCSTVLRQPFSSIHVHSTTEWMPRRCIGREVYPVCAEDFIMQLKLQSNCGASFVCAEPYLRSSYASLSATWANKHSYTIWTYFMSHFNIQLPTHNKHQQHLLQILFRPIITISFCSEVDSFEYGPKERNQAFGVSATLCVSKAALFILKKTLEGLHFGWNFTNFCSSSPLFITNNKKQHNISQKQHNISLKQVYN
jgi:hypothetical protein